MKNRLEELRKLRGIKQEDLATALEVSRQTVGSLENGRYNPSILLAFKIARYFQMSIEEIFIYEEESKSKHKLWYIGYIVSAILVPIILFTDFPKTADIGLLILMSIIFSISHTQLMHNRMMKNDIDYKVNVMDERNISIKEKSGNITNMITMVLLGIVTVIFISFDYFIPTIITGVIIAVQPIILIIVSNMIEKKM